jgi:hypothetical protein
MNRNGTAILATAILFSMLASSGVRQGAPGRADASALPLKNSSSGLVNPRHQARSPRDPEAGETGYGDDINKLFGQYCQDGSPKRDGADKKECGLGPDNFVIAIVPDPVHTHLALYFDRTIDTIEEALQDDGYIFDQAVVPWDNETHPESDDFTLRLDAKQYQEDREHLPGVMLFRPSQDLGAAKGPLAVMLVGESPTGGVEIQQFSNAIRQILKRTRFKESELTLRILGPTFSGSLSSLKKILTCGNNPCYGGITILSGTISGRREVEDFRAKESDVKATFDTFQETDGVVLERFIEFLAGKGFGDRHYDVRRIAELSEDETSYGSLRPSASQSEFPAKSGYCKDFPAESEDSVQTCSMLRLYFPREISQLRAAYQDNSRSANGADRLPVQALPHNYGVTGGDDDTVASFSQKQTPLSQEAVLLSIVAELRKHAIEFVVLNATDPMDTLFLSHYLRAAYPQGRIVTINADMLFPREVEDTSLHGILALSTYSVSPSANHEFYQLRQRSAERMFPSSSEIGTYNALHSLLSAQVSQQRCKRSELVEFDNKCADRLWSPETPLYLIQYGWRERGAFSGYNAPPVRLSALGHDGYWPIANLGPFSGEASFTVLPQVEPANQFSSEPARLEVPNSWIAIEVVGLALAIGFCLSLWFASVRSPLQQLAQFAPTEAGVRIWLIAAAGFFLIFVLLILLWPFVHGRLDWVMTDARIHARILGLAIFAVFAVTLLEITERSGLFYARPRPGETTWSTIGNLAALFAFEAASIALAYFSLTERSNGVENLAGIRHFEVLRAIQLTSGLSPILPILFFLAAGLWWANHTISGWIFLDDRCPRLPSGIQPLQIGEDGEIGKDLLKALRPGFSSTAHYLILLSFALGAWLLTRFSFSPIRTVEPWRFDQYQLLPFLVVASAGLIGTALRLWTIWFRARQLLVALDSSPLRRGFQQLKGFSWKPIWKFGGGGALDEYRRLLARQREALQHAQDILPQASKDILDRRLGRTRASYDSVRDEKHAFSLKWVARRREEQELIEDFGRFQCGVALAARDAMNYLAKHWSREKEESKRRTGQETAHELKMRACERFVSLVYVSFLLVVLARMRSLILAIGGMYILILLALTLYPFEPRPGIQIFLVATLAFITTVVGLIFAQIHRDATLSHITDTTPGELGGDFYLRMASFVALPLFTFFASQFPEIGRSFYSWLEPALQALNR